MAKFGILAALLSPALAACQEPLRWGADKTGGAPYIYENAAGELIGFEVELAAYLCEKIGRESVPVNGDWSKLPELLQKGDEIDIVLNGYEYNPALQQRFPATIPYYVYRLTLLKNRSNSEIKSWDDLNGKTVGVLTGSAAQDYVDSTYPKANVLASDDVANVIDLVARGERFDATVQDNVTASHFLKEYPNLEAAPEARSLGYYVILTRPEDVQLRSQLNAAIREGLQDGSLREIYRKYGLWNADQQVYAASHEWPPVGYEELPGAESEPVNWPLIIEKLLRASVVTVLLSCLSFPLAILIGMGVAIGRLYGPRLLRFPLLCYVELIRGTPLLLQLFFLFYLLPRILPISMDPFWTAVIGLAINYSAYEAENYRAGLLAVPRGQMEAALSLGFRPGTALRVVIIPQALRIVIPPVTNDFIALFKDTSVCSVILVTELTRQYNELFNFNRAVIVELALITAGLYMLMSYPLARFARSLERHDNRH